MGPDIWGLQKKGKRAKIFFEKKGYFGHKTYESVSKQYLICLVDPLGGLKIL